LQIHIGLSIVIIIVNNTIYGNIRNIFESEFHITSITLDFICKFAFIIGLILFYDFTITSLMGEITDDKDV